MRSITLEPLLATLDRNQLRDLRLRLVARQPDLADVIAGEVAVTQARTTPRAAPTRPPADVGPIQRQVRALLGSSYRGYDGYDIARSIAEGMGAILDQVQKPPCPHGEPGRDAPRNLVRVDWCPGGRCAASGGDARALHRPRSTSSRFWSPCCCCCSAVGMGRSP